MESVSAEDQKRTTSEALLTEGSLWRSIWVMSWPLLITTVAGSIVGVVDVQVAGFLGSDTQAAVGLSEQVLFLFMIFIMSVSVGTTALVSRSFGAQNQDETVLATAQSLALSLLIGIFLCLLSFLVAHLVLPFFTRAPAVVRNGQLYLGIFSLYLIPFSITSILNASYRAIGDAKTPMLVVLVMTAISAAGDYLTVVGNWPVPGLGIRGIALSALTGSSVAAGVAVWRLNRSVLKDSLERVLPLCWTTMMRVISVGVPSAFQRLSWALAVFVLFFVLSRCQNPTQAIAAWTIGMRVEGLVFMPLMALSLAVSSIVGQNVGARQIERAFRAGWHVTWIGVGLMCVLGAALFAFAEPLARLMSHDPRAVAYTASYIRINAPGEPFLAIGMILTGAMQGAGDTRAPMWISIFSNWLVRMPIAWLLAQPMGLGPSGVWLSMTTSIVVMAALVAWRFQSGSWVKVKV